MTQKDWIHYGRVQVFTIRFEFWHPRHGRQDQATATPLLDGDEKVILDFTGVNVVTNSFADECIAKLLLEMSLADLKKHTTFRGLNPLAERCVLVALQRRYRVILSENK